MPKTTKKNLEFSGPGHQNLSFEADAVFHRMIENIEEYAILLIDKDGIILNWNKGAEKIKGYDSSEIIGKNFRVFYTEEDRKSKLPERLLKKAKKFATATDEGWRVRKDGSSFWGSITITALYDYNQNVVGYTKVTRDLTEKKAASEKIRQAIMEAQEREREELSSILHDNVSQLLVAGVLFAGMVEKKCDSVHMPVLKNYLQLAIEELRKLSHRLNPVAELSSNLSEAIVMMTEDLNMLSKTTFTFYEKGKPQNINLEMKKMLFRIVQELISNILKYAEATEARISLTWRPKELGLEISDNGIGFDIAKIIMGLGLRNMQLRLKNYNGKAIIKSVQGSGCTIRISLPFENI